jgi:hypothetical protein
MSPEFSTVCLALYSPPEINVQIVTDEDLNEVSLATFCQEGLAFMRVKWVLGKITVKYLDLKFCRCLCMTIV